MTSFRVSLSFPPTRLDKILAGHEGLGLRQCRELIAQNAVRVDGRLLRKGDLVRAGQVVTVDVGVFPAVPDRAADARVTVIVRTQRFAALFKPGGMHSVAGRGVPCLESWLPDLGLADWRLINRLDFLTSGLVLAAHCPEDEAAYTEWQNNGLVQKWYLAQAHGPVTGPLCARGRILDDKRRVVQVTDEEDVALRRTEIYPVSAVGADSLVLLRIFKGRRHQIRAHLAHIGHPLLGDPVYGLGEPGGLYLHHWRVDMPDFFAAHLPAWKGIAVEEIESVYARRQSMLCDFRH